MLFGLIDETVWMNLCTFMGEAAYPMEYIGDEDEDDIFIFCLEGERVIREGKFNLYCDRQSVD